MRIARRTTLAALATTMLALSIGCSLAFPVDDRFKSTSTPAASGDASASDGAPNADGASAGGNDGGASDAAREGAAIPPFDCDGAVLCRSFDGPGEKADAGWSYAYVGAGNAFETANDFFLSPSHAAHARAQPGVPSAFVGQWLPTATKRSQLRLAFSFRANQLTEVRPFTMILSAGAPVVTAPYTQIWPKLSPISGKLVLDVTEKYLDVDGDAGTMQYAQHPITNRLVDVGEWIALDVWATGTAIVVSMNGVEVLHDQVKLPWVSGYPLVELGAVYYQDADLEIDDVRAFLP